MTGDAEVGMVAAQGNLNGFLPKFVATYPMNDRGCAIFRTWSHANVIHTGRLERQDRKMRLVTAIFNRFSRSQASKPDAFDARLVSLAGPANKVYRRSRVAAPRLFRGIEQSAV